MSIVNVDRLHPQCSESSTIYSQMHLHGKVVRVKLDSHDGPNSADELDLSDSQ